MADCWLTMRSKTKRNLYKKWLKTDEEKYKAHRKLWLLKQRLLTSYYRDKFHICTTNTMKQLWQNLYAVF